MLVRACAEYEQVIVDVVQDQVDSFQRMPFQRMVKLDGKYDYIVVSSSFVSFTFTETEINDVRFCGCVVFICCSAF